MKQYLTNAQLVLSDRVLENATLLVEDGVIAAINPEITSEIVAIDLEQQILMPGAIDLHCDAIEKAVEPRPEVFFPIDFAISQVDRHNAMAGITTPFHALSFANEELGVRNNQMAAKIVQAFSDYRPHGLVDNHIHCRYEMTDSTGLPVLLDLLENNLVHLLSLMDHTPGQGQFKDIQAYQNYLSRTYNKTTAETEAIIEQKIANAAGTKERIEMLVKQAEAQGVVVASHDDDTPERIQNIVALGVTLSEFPVNWATAQAAKSHQLATIFGAPNVLRGQSQSGSMKAIEAIHHQVASCLCSDYAPSTLLTAVFQIFDRGYLSLPEAVALATKNPAQALNLRDRGEIAVGKRADLVAVQQLRGLPQVTQTWVAGHQVYVCYYQT